MYQISWTKESKTGLHTVSMQPVQLYLSNNNDYHGAKLSFRKTIYGKNIRIYTVPLQCHLIC